MPRAASSPKVRHDQALTDRQVAAAVRKPGTYADGNGLALVVLDTGTASWRYRYRLDGKAGVAVLGSYPDMSLSAARVALAEARKDVAAGIKPALRKWNAAEQANTRTKLAASTFGEVAEKWFAAAQSDAWTQGTADKTRGRLDNHLKPTGLWNTPIAMARVEDLAALLDKLHYRQPDTATKVRQIMSGVFRYAAARGLVQSDPVALTRPGSGQGKGGSRKHKPKRKLPACTDLEKLGAILRAIERAQSIWQVRSALMLMAYTGQRPGRVVAARWEEFALDGTNPTWTIPRELQKVKDDQRGDHRVPLAPAVVELLRALPRDDEFVFATSGGHVTLDAPSKLLRVTLALAGVHTPHGFRSALSTNANRETRDDGSRRFDRVDIEFILDHDEERSDTEASYDRDRSLPRMRTILEWWAHKLNSAKANK